MDYPRFGAVPTIREPRAVHVYFVDLLACVELSRPREKAIVLAFANLALATAQFAEPVLFARVIDRLSAAKSGSQPLSFGDLTPLLAAWAGFGIFSIVAGVLVALNADRLAHRRRLAVMALFLNMFCIFP